MQKRLLYGLLSGIVITFMISILPAQTRDRSEIPGNLTWNLTEIYANDDAWQAAADELTKRIQEITPFKGSLGKSAIKLLNCLDLQGEIDKELLRLYCYGFLAFDLDNRDSKYLSMKSRGEQLSTDFGALCSFIAPEILEINGKKIEKFLKQEPGLAKYRVRLNDLQRQKAHRLSAPEEKIIAEAGSISGGTRTSYGVFTNAEMPWPNVVFSDGRKVVLDQANFSLYRASRNRDDREAIFKSFFGTYGDFSGTIGTLMDNKIKKDIFYSKVRKYDNTLEYYLDGDNIPEEVYHTLIRNVHDNFAILHRYLDIRKRMLGVDTLKYSDLYVPLVGALDLSYSVEEARQMVLDAVAPLGEEYAKTVQFAYDNRWIDLYSTPGKRTGAYSMSAAYDVHPYILMNYNGQYANVSTLAHELGHTMHSYFANKTQPYATADYTTFVAEVASTLNEILLFRDQLAKTDDDDLKLYLLLEYIDRMKSTIFRQTQFAEFELRMHEMAERSEQITGDALTEMYKGLVREYYGHDQNICFVDDAIDYEWAYIPHFYRDYYVFQYSTSWTASEALADGVQSGDPEAIQRYIAFISAGGSDYPINLLKKAGVDMTTDKPFRTAMQSMNWAMDEVDAILARKGI